MNESWEIYIDTHDFDGNIAKNVDFVETNLMNLKFRQAYIATWKTVTVWILRMEIISDGIGIIQTHIQKYLDISSIGLHQRGWVLGYHIGLGDM